MNRINEIAKVITEEYNYLTSEIDTDAMAITLRSGYYMWQGQDLLRILALCQAYGLIAQMFTNVETRTPMLTISKRITNK